MGIFDRYHENDDTTYETERLWLKVLKPHQAEVALSYYWRNRNFLEEWDPDREEGFYTKKGQANLLRYEYRLFKDRDFLRLWLFKKENPEKAIGNICFSNLIYGNFKSCFLAYKLDKDELFDYYGLHRIEANIIPRNHRSLRVVEKLNFEKEGFSKRYLKINGIWEDHWHFAIYNDK